MVVVQDISREATKLRQDPNINHTSRRTQIYTPLSTPSPHTHGDGAAYSGQVGGCRCRTVVIGHVYETLCVYDAHLQVNGQGKVFVVQEIPRREVTNLRQYMKYTNTVYKAKGNHSSRRTQSSPPLTIRLLVHHHPTPTPLPHHRLPCIRWLRECYVSRRGIKWTPMDESLCC